MGKFSFMTQDYSMQISTVTFLHKMETDSQVSHLLLLSPIQSSSCLADCDCLHKLRIHLLPSCYQVLGVVSLPKLLAVCFRRVAAPGSCKIQNEHISCNAQDLTNLLLKLPKSLQNSPDIAPFKAIHSHLWSLPKFQT